MGVASQVAKNLIGPAERGLGVDHPVQLLQPGYPVLEADRVSEFAQLAVKLQPARRKLFFQVKQEFTAEESAEWLHRQKELELAGDAPSVPVSR